MDRVELSHLSPPLSSLQVPFERVMAVSYRRSIMTTVLSITIRSQFVIEYIRCSN